MKQTMSAFQLKHIDILHFIVATQSTKRGHGAVGSAFEWHSKGQGFESPWLHQSEYKLNPSTCILFLCYFGGIKVLQCNKKAR